MTTATRLHASAEDLSKDYLTPCKSNIHPAYPQYPSSVFQHIHLLAPNR